MPKKESKGSAKAGKGAEAGTGVEDTLSRVAKRIGESPSARTGQIVFHLAGAGGGEYRLDCAPGRAKVTSGAAGLAEGAPVLEVTGDAALVRAILDGKKDPLKQFAAGGLRVRGDLRYLSNLALELGLIDTPL